MYFLVAYKFSGSKTSWLNDSLAYHVDGINSIDIINKKVDLEHFKFIIEQYQLNVECLRTVKVKILAVSKIEE